MEDAIIKVKVLPNASSNKIIGWENDELKIRLTAIPEKGKANEALIKLLAKRLDIPLSSIKVIGGTTSRHKKLLIKNLDITLFESLIREES
ncbi:MAG: DUF167 domain-containing protein [Parachlamydiaceae bacterium]